MEWVRGDLVGHGSFGTVNLAIPRNQSPQIPPLMAVKSCGVSHSASLVNEKSILNKLNDCPQIVRCFGDNLSFGKNGEKLFNLLLEYASGGSLADKIRNSGKFRSPESEIRRYTKSILKGLQYIHENGFVHCDIKLENILLFPSEDGPDYEAKIADFGLAKKSGGERREKVGFELRGTPLYMSPETVIGGEQEMQSDIWALGCAVSEMVTGAPAWRCSPESGVGPLLMRIGVGDEVPEIPGKISVEGKDFLGKCFLKDPSERWTTEMLLNHPFLTDLGHDDVSVPLKDRSDCEAPSTSPRCPFDFPDWVSAESWETCSITYLPSPEQSPDSDSWFDRELNLGSGSLSDSPAVRLWRLVTEQGPDWSVSSSWVTVR